jgi:hypothetical protein
MSEGGDSDRSQSGPDPELEELFRDIDMARTQAFGDAERRIDEYFERKDGHERAVDRRKSGERASTPGGRPIPMGKWKLDQHVWVDEPARSMTEAEIKKLRKDWIIPSSVTLRPVGAGESAARPPPGLIAIHEHMFKHGFTLPLPGWVQYILAALGFAPGQLSPNAWRQLLGMSVLWFFSGQGWPTRNEVLGCYRPSYSTKKGCGGTVSLNSRTIGTIVEDLPTSQTDWRKTVCFAGGRWEYDGVVPAGQVPNAFQPIGLALLLLHAW